MFDVDQKVIYTGDWYYLPTGSIGKILSCKINVNYYPNCYYDVYFPFKGVIAVTPKEIVKFNKINYLLYVGGFGVETTD